MTGDEAIAVAIRAGCMAGDVHLTCSYPSCACKTTPVIVRAAITEWRKAKPTQESGTFRITSDGGSERIT